MEQIAPIILILVGLFLVVLGLIQAMRVKAASKWLTTTGELLKAELTEHVTKNRTSTGRMTTFSSYEPSVEYTYSVAGQRLTGNRFSIGMTRLPLEQAQSELDKLTGGGQVTVYYNPRNPKESRLQTKSAAAGPLLIIGLIIAAIGLVWLVITL